MYDIVMRFNTDGTASTIYSDEYDYKKLFGGVKIGRASRIEPNETGEWTVEFLFEADGISGVQGPFAKREEAIEFEHRVINELLREGNLKLSM